MRVGQEVGQVGLERMMLVGMKWDGMRLGCGVKTECVVVVVGVEGCHGRVGLMTHAQARADGLNISFDCIGFTAKLCRLLTRLQYVTFPDPQQSIELDE